MSGPRLNLNLPARSGPIPGHEEARPGLGGGSGTPDLTPGPCPRLQGRLLSKCWRCLCSQARQALPKASMAPCINVWHRESFLQAVAFTPYGNMLTIGPLVPLHCFHCPITL